MQEALLKVARSWKSYRGEARFKTWLFAIVINVFRDRMRSESRDGQLPGEIEDAKGALPGERVEAQELGGCGGADGWNAAAAAERGAGAECL